MSSYLTPLTNASCAPLLVEPQRGEQAYDRSDPFMAFDQTLIDDASIACREHAMVLFINRDTGCILLEVPNALGWKLHFGIELAPEDDGATAVAAAVAASGVAAPGPPRPTGVMLFTFRDAPDPPMRVRVYEVAVDGHQSVGLFYAPAEVPYDKMWADDRVWLPHVLDKPYDFSGHFVFGGPPGGSSKLVAHNFRGARDRGLSFWE